VPRAAARAIALTVKTARQQRSAQLANSPVQSNQAQTGTRRLKPRRATRTAGPLCTNPPKTKTSAHCGHRIGCRKQGERCGRISLVGVDMVQAHQRTCARALHSTALAGRRERSCQANNSTSCDVRRSLREAIAVYDVESAVD